MTARQWAARESRAFAGHRRVRRAIAHDVRAALRRHPALAVTSADRVYGRLRGAWVVLLVLGPAAVGTSLLVGSRTGITPARDSLQISGPLFVVATVALSVLAFADRRASRMRRRSGRLRRVDAVGLGLLPFVTAMPLLIPITAARAALADLDHGWWWVGTMVAFQTVAIGYVVRIAMVGPRPRDDRAPTLAAALPDDTQRRLRAGLVAAIDDLEARGVITPRDADVARAAPLGALAVTMIERTALQQRHPRARRR